MTALQLDMAEQTIVAPERMRDAMSRFCSGVTIVTGIDPETHLPIGFTCQSFMSLSLDPPMILIAPGAHSRTWPRIREAGSFTVNVLAAHQQWLSSTFGRAVPDKFAGVSWRPGMTGAPRISSSAAWVDCTLVAEHDGGDHTIVVGGVHEVAVTKYDRPLLFHRSKYATT